MGNGQIVKIYKSNFKKIQAQYLKKERLEIDPMKKYSRIWHLLF
jgi:hypothetical protein